MEESNRYDEIGTQQAEPIDPANLVDSVADETADDPVREGRPTKYKPEYCQEIIEFFSIPPSREVEVVQYDKSGNDHVTYQTKANPIPFFAAFARKIGVNDDTIVEWEKVHPEFSAAYKKAKELQKEFLIENGLAGLYNATFAIFTAKNITDMRDVRDFNNNVILKDGEVTRERAKEILAELAASDDSSE